MSDLLKRLLSGIACLLMLVLAAAGCQGTPPDADSSLSHVDSSAETGGFSPDFSTPEKTLQSFGEAVRTGDLELYNSLFSEGFLSRYGKHETLEAHPDFSVRDMKRYSGDDMRKWGYDVDDIHQYFRMEPYDGETFVGDGGNFGCCYAFILEKDGWKIDSIATSFA